MVGGNDFGQRLLTTRQVAKLLSVTTRSVCAWAKAGDIPAIRVGKLWRFRGSAVTKWIGKRQSSLRLATPRQSADTNQAHLR